MISRMVIAKVVGLALVLLLVAGCAQLGAPSAAPAAPAATPMPPAVRVAAAARGPVAATLTYPGNVTARAQVPVYPEVAGRIKRLAVDVGSEVKTGQVIAELDTSALELTLAQAQAALDVAKAKLATMEANPRPEQVALANFNLQAAQARLDGMKAGGRPELVAQADANYKAAEARLEQARKGATPEQIAEAEANVRLAHNNEYYQQQQSAVLDRILNQIPGDVNDGGLRHAQDGIAWEQSKIAEAKLAEVKAGATAEQLTQLEMAAEAARQQWLLAQKPYQDTDIAQAQAAVNAAQEQLALAKKPFTASELQAARAGVDQAQSAFDLAKLQVQKATITAPLDGVVSQRLAAEGAMASPVAPIITLVSRDMEVTVNVEEARLGLVRVGQQAKLSVATYPGETFAAEVAAIAPSVDQRARTVAVKIRPQPTSKLMDGMFAQVSITTGEQAEALRVPIAAVADRDGKKVVFVVRDGVASLREVKLGLSDGTMVEVAEGLAEGEDVALEQLDSLADGQSVRPSR